MVPNLGPLVITATVWHVPSTVAVERVPDYLALTEVITAAGQAPILGDSKRLYSPGSGLANLERGVLAALALVDGGDAAPGTWRALLQRLAPHCLSRLVDIPWYATYDCRLPVDADSGQVASARSQLVATLAAADIRLTRDAVARGVSRRVQRAGGRLRQQRAPLCRSGRWSLCDT